MRGKKRKFLLPAMLFAVLASPTWAARPLLEQHQWDRYIALSARDIEVPWKPATVRIATYSGAPVDFAVYNIDPAEVIIAGQHRSARAVDTRGRRPLARWRFRPPAGYRFEVSRVAVPLGSQEGFYVVEAHRGTAAQQVWINRTHIGLVTKESPKGLAVWCVDLRTGLALRGAHVAFLVGQELIGKQADAHGLVVWNDRARPSFALADHGAARAFVSFLPQAPPPPAVVGLRLESAVARTGETVRFIGFARKRSADAYRRAAGDVRVSLIGKGKVVAQSTASLDEAGAFTGELRVPKTAETGAYAVLAALVGGEGVGGTSLRVDAETSVVLGIRAHRPSVPDQPLELTIIARGPQEERVADLPVSVRIVRTPHVIPPGEADDAERWGTTVVYEKTVRTDANGEARVVVFAPTDGLASSYGVRASASGAAATTRVTVTRSTTALAIEPDARNLATGDAAGFSVRGFDATDGAPAKNLPVRVRLVHGPVSRERAVRLDGEGRAHVLFPNASLGTDFAFARAQGRDGRSVLDATAVNVDPSNRDISSAERVASEQLAGDCVRAGDFLTVTVRVPGGSGDALITLEGERVYRTLVARIREGRVTAKIGLSDIPAGMLLSVAAVRDGVVVVRAVSPASPGAGREPGVRSTSARVSFATGERAEFRLRGADMGRSTVLVRIADGRESESAYFDDAPGLLRTAGVTTQNPASSDPAWHAFVAPRRSNAADIYAVERPRTQRSENLTLGSAVPRTLLWRIERNVGGKITVPLPEESGRYLLSLLRIGDDGGVDASSVSVTVQ